MGCREDGGGLSWLKPGLLPLPFIPVEVEDPVIVCYSSRSGELH